MLLEFLSVNLSMDDTPPYFAKRLFQLINQSFALPLLTPPRPRPFTCLSFEFTVKFDPPDPSGSVLLIHLRPYLCAWCLMPVICKQSCPIGWSRPWREASPQPITSHWVKAFWRLKGYITKAAFKQGFGGWTLVINGRG